jgi:hypothetical protein
MMLPPLQFDLLCPGDVDDFSVNSRPDKTLPLELLDHIAKLANFTLHDGSEDHNASLAGKARRRSTMSWTVSL